VIAPHRGRNGSGLVRRPRRKRAQKGRRSCATRDTRIVRETTTAGKVSASSPANGDSTVQIRATKGVIIATVATPATSSFPPHFDPRLTGNTSRPAIPTLPNSDAQAGLGHMDIGASFWGERYPEPRRRVVPPVTSTPT